MSYLKKCPRCNDETYERLTTHQHCFSCNYSPDLLAYRKEAGDDLPIPPWAAKALAKMKANQPRSSVQLVHLAPKQNKQKGSAA